VIGSPDRRSHPGIWFAAFTIASLLMLLASRTDPATALQQASARALEPVRAAVAGVGQGVAGLFGTIGEIDRLQTENDKLRSDLTRAQQRIAELQEAAAENTSLRGLLGLTKSLVNMDLLPVRVIARDPSNFTWEVGIDAGSRDGVADGMPVVGAATGGGALVGTIVPGSVQPDSSRVRFIVDPRSSVVALDQTSRALGEVEGQLGGQLVFVQVPVTERLAPGDTVVTAGLSLGTGLASPYPKGLLIGTIQAVQPDPNALTQTAFVRPALDPQQVERLLVVTSFSQD
jgi:rod shape-determining protein MreC